MKVQANATKFPLSAGGMTAKSTTNGWAERNEFSLTTKELSCYAQSIVIRTATKFPTTKNVDKISDDAPFELDKFFAYHANKNNHITFNLLIN